MRFNYANMKLRLEPYDEATTRPMIVDTCTMNRLVAEAVYIDDSISAASGIHCLLMVGRLAALRSPGKIFVSVRYDARLSRKPARVRTIVVILFVSHRVMFTKGLGVVVKPFICRTETGLRLHSNRYCHTSG